MEIEYLIVQELKDKDANLYDRSRPILLYTPDNKTVSLNQLGQRGWLLSTVNDGRWIFSRSK